MKVLDGYEERESAHEKNRYVNQRRDCQSLNATMRGVAKSLYKMFDDIEIVGFEDGYKGLMYADYRIMKQSDFSGILTRGGTILGTSRQPSS